jgi:CheY-like chemotaxis protein
VKKIVIVSKQMGNCETLIKLLNMLFPECEIRVVLLHMEGNVSSPEGISSGDHMADAVRSGKMDGECLPVVNQRVHVHELCDRTRRFLARVKGANKRILVVDDEESIRNVVSHLLSMEDIEKAMQRIWGT